MAWSTEIWTKCLLIVVILATAETATTAHHTKNTKGNIDSIVKKNVEKSCHNGDTTSDFFKICSNSNLYENNCSKFGTCTHGVIISENKTHIEFTRFEKHSQVSRPLEGEVAFLYAIHVSVDPFENNGMGTSKPKCKKQLNISDFIVRIFRYKNVINYTIGQNERNMTPSTGSKSSTWLMKNDWGKLCKNEIVKEYQSRINTFDTRYIVFQNKFYFDIDKESLGSYDVPYSLLEDFKDPESYNTSDRRLYLNFDQNFKNLEKSSSSGNRLLSKLFVIFTFQFICCFFILF